VARRRNPTWRMAGSMLQVSSAGGASWNRLCRECGAGVGHRVDAVGDGDHGQISNSGVRGKLAGKKFQSASIGGNSGLSRMASRPTPGVADAP
jgi:hypothetical protein